MRPMIMLCVLALAASWLQPAAGAEPVLTLSVGGKTESQTATALLARSDAVDVTVAVDPAYGGSVTYRAVPLAALIAPLGMKADDVLEVTALDGFVAQLPGALVMNVDPAAAVAYVAVEPPGKHWPALPGKQASAGPFSVIWQGKDVKSIVPDQWPYQIASMGETEPVEKRWPQLAVDPKLPPNDPLRLGLQKFTATCGACHQLAGGGAAKVGPDLNRPMSPTEYFQPAAFRKYLRDPASVRDWVDRKMPGFGPDALSDDDLTLIIGYLDYKAKTRPP